MKKELTNLQVIKRLIKLVKPLMLPMCFAILMGVLGFICAIFIPVFSVMTLVQIIEKTLWFPIYWLFIILLVFALLRGILHYGEQACNHYIAFKLLAIIRDQVYSTLRRLAPAKLDGRDKGNLITLITNDVELLEVFYAHTISPFFIAVLTSLVMLVFFWNIHFVAAIIALVAYIVMSSVIPFYVNQKGQQIGKMNRDKIGDISSYILESFRGLSTIMQYHLAKQRTSQMIKRTCEIESLMGRLKVIESSQIVFSQILISLSAIVMFLSMYILYCYSLVSFGDVVIATVAMLSSFGPVLALSNLANNLLSTLNSGRRILALLDEEPMTKDIAGKTSSSFGHIDTQNLSFQYDQEMILNNFNVHFDESQINGLIGRSGSGKSTLLKLIMRFYDPTSGIITIHDRQLNQINTSDLRQMFAYVTQETVLFHDSIYNNIQIANLNATKEEIEKACREANIHDFIMSLPQGYQTPVSELGSSLSGGEKQRISLARAFISPAPCILLDEPTSHLDVLNEAMILKSLKKTNKTVVLVSHRESTMKIADQIITIDQGRAS